MSDLDDLLEAARSADPASRILLRDAIAAHGEEAIAAMAEWLHDPRLGGFGVRVLQRIAADPASRGAVVAALSAVDGRRLSPKVAGDVAQALAALHPPTVSRANRTSQGSRASFRGGGRDLDEASTTEERFHDAMLDIYWLAGRATGYWASYFLRAVRNHGGVAAARELLRKTGTSPGFERLTAERRLDLSMEALVIKPEFSGQFTTREVQIARERLADAGYRPDRP